MVSFSCEACGDVLTKKKLDAHHRQCQGSTFTCLDCMTHFRGTDYRSHTSCVSEDQKYQGALYKEKPSKKSVKISEPKQRPRSAFVEDAPDVDGGNAITIVHPPPLAPSPPSARHVQPAQPVNVFDFLDTGETPKPTPHATPHASKVSLGGLNDSMQMVEHAPKNFGDESRNGREKDGINTHGNEFYEQQGYSYGEEPVAVIDQQPMIEYITPGPKHRRHDGRNSVHDFDKSHKKSSDKKRKRGHVEEMDYTGAQRPSQELEVAMDDVPPAILHSGLTGGLNRLLTKPKHHQNPDHSPPSPAKRSKRNIKDNGEGLSRGRNGALVKVRKRRSSDESRPRKHQRSHHSPDHHSHREQSKQKTIEDRPKRKAIEYTSQADVDNSQNRQLVPINSRAELFTSFVTKGPESEQGYSLHKALKRYHREREDLGVGLGKSDEERELFKNLRLKRNARGEIVVFF